MADTGNVDTEVKTFVNDFLQYKLRQNGYQWSSCSLSADENEADGPIATKVGAALRSLADEFASLYKDNYLEMCERLELTESTIKPAIVGVANELFSEGIGWARIVAFFVFGSELAVHCQERNWPQLVDIVAHSVSSYISEKLLPWINDHGGWEGLIAFNEGADPDHRNDRWPSVKNLLCLGISAIGALSIGALLTKS